MIRRKTRLERQKRPSASVSREAAVFEWWELQEEMRAGLAVISVIVPSKSLLQSPGSIGWRRRSL